MNSTNNYVLNIGSKKYSSWSLRVWLLMKVKGIHFDENIIPFITALGKREFDNNTKLKIFSISKTGRVPSLSINNISISESLVILEYLNDSFPDLSLWPNDIYKRASARVLSGALYSGFHATKLSLPFVGDGRKKNTKTSLTGHLKNDLDILLNLLPDTLDTTNGKYIFDTFSIADAMLIPFLLRYYSYNIDIPDNLASYLEAVISSEPMQSWIAAAQEESEEIIEIEQIYTNFPKRASVEYKL